MNNPPLRIEMNPMESAVPISRASLVALIGEDAVNAGERRFAMETVEPWQIVRSIRALAVTAEWAEKPWGGRAVTSYTFHGDQTGRQVTQPGTWSECRVSIGGKKLSAFTSSVMFKTEDGKLVDVAVLHCRTPKA